MLTLFGVSKNPDPEGLQPQLNTSEPANQGVTRHTRNFQADEDKLRLNCRILAREYLTIGR